MDDKRLGNVEAMFADIIWKNEPLSSGELAKICAEELKWNILLFKARNLLRILLEVRFLHLFLRLQHERN